MGDWVGLDLVVMEWFNEAAVAVVATGIRWVFRSIRAGGAALQMTSDVAFPFLLTPSDSQLVGKR